MSGQHKKVSKYLSFLLRHQPESIGLNLDDGGWADLEELIAKADPELELRADLIHAVVQSNDKQRFKLSADGKRIRANQGHSIDVELALEALEPPGRLFHGTARRFLEAILEEGLRPMNRQHVHLSADSSTAINVGSRHGKPVVLTVQAAEMWSEGFEFFCSENGVWLTTSVPSRFLSADES